MNGVPMAQAFPAAVADSAPDRLAALFDAHYDRLYRLARRLAPSTDAARDLVQETFLRAARSPRSIPHGGGEAAWLVRVLVNIQRDEWRRSDVRRRTPQRHDTVSIDHEDAVIARATVWRALDALPPRRRAIVVMHELDGESVATIAAWLGVTRVTVRWHLSRGRRELGRILGAEIGESNDHH